MPNLNAPQNCSDEKCDITLEQLLKLKREERPSDEFWESFDRQLQQRTLQTLVKRSSIRERLRPYFEGFGRLLIPATVCAVVAGAFSFQLFKQSAHVTIAQPLADIGVQSLPVFEDIEEPVLQVSTPVAKSAPQQRMLAASEARFVLDRLSLDFDTDASYRKVLAAEPLTLSSDGAQYVADPIGSGSAARLISQQGLYQHF